MHNLRHFYYQNKEKIWKVVLIIAFLLGIIYFLNWQTEEKMKESPSTSNNTTVNYSDGENNTYISDKSAISGGTVTEKDVEKINDTISKFLQYCKNEKKEEAYNMLSADCKETEYDTLEKFQEKYLDKKFSKDDVYEIENWLNNTYKITISKDLLSTGDANAQKRIEYITIVTENSEKKLNVNSYIGQKDINKEKTEKNVKITVVSKKKYLDYEIYNFKIENLSDKTININTLQKIGTMHLEDSNGNKYNAYSHEILEEDLEIKSKRKIDISIKYANSYSSRTNIEKIVFENIILDYVQYQKVEDVELFEDICEITINI